MERVFSSFQLITRVQYTKHTKHNHKTKEHHPTRHRFIWNDWTLTACTASSRSFSCSSWGDCCVVGCYTGTRENNNQVIWKLCTKMQRCIIFDCEIVVTQPQNGRYIHGYWLINKNDDTKANSFQWLPLQTVTGRTITPSADKENRNTCPTNLIRAMEYYILHISLLHLSLLLSCLQTFIFK